MKRKNKFYSKSYATNPSKGLGSNQVDLGGIFNFLSAKLITFSICVANKAKPTFASPEYTLF